MSTCAGLQDKLSHCQSDAEEVPSGAILILTTRMSSPSTWATMSASATPTAQDNMAAPADPATLRVLPGDSPVQTASLQQSPTGTSAGQTAAAEAAFAAAWLAALSTMPIPQLTEYLQACHPPAIKAQAARELARRACMAGNSCMSTAGFSEATTELLEALPEALDSLLELLQDTDTEVQLSALESVAAVLTNSADRADMLLDSPAGLLTSLVGILHSEQPMQQAAAAAVVRALCTPVHPRAPAGSADKLIAPAGTDLNSPCILSGLVAVLEAAHTPAQSVMDALHALAHLVRTQPSAGCHPAALQSISQLVALLSHADSAVQAAAAGALADTAVGASANIWKPLIGAEPGALSHLVRMLFDADRPAQHKEVAEAALAALCQGQPVNQERVLQEEGFTECLVSLLTQGQHRQFQVLCRSLMEGRSFLQGLCGHPAAVPALVLAFGSDFMYQDILGFKAFYCGLLLSMAKFDTAVVPVIGCQPGVREALHECETEEAEALLHLLHLAESCMLLSVA